MKPVKVGVVDYGMGNLHSVSKAFSAQGAKVIVTDSRKKLRESHLLVLPGVGAFGAAMRTLAKKKLDEFVQHWIEQDRPYLGICLGYQLLFQRGEESPRVRGLGLFRGVVRQFPLQTLRKKRLPVPHMGWNTLTRKQEDSKGLMDTLSNKDRFYFVHSYYPVPEDSSLVFTSTNYGVPFASSIQKGRLFASQFHPEKSGVVGQRLIKNILKAAIQ